MNSHRFETPTAAILGALALVCSLAARPAAAQQQVTIPRDTVVHAVLETRLTTETARPGDTFAARLAPEDRGGFPIGTRFEGTVTEVQTAADDRPGILDMRVRTAILPDNRQVTVDGRLASLAEDAVRVTADGRLEARPAAGGQRFDPRWIGYGAGAGALLAIITRGNLIRGALFGGLAGTVYAVLRRDRGPEQFREVVLPPGTDFGIRMAETVAFDHRPTYQFAVREQVAGEQEEFRRDDLLVRVDGRQVQFGDLRPMTLNGVPYVPLAPIAAAANMTFAHQPGTDVFTLRTPAGVVEGTAGDASVILSGRMEPVDHPPLNVSGTIYVSPQFLSTVAGLEVEWDRVNHRLDLHTTPML
jgi:hypothetical protein